MALSPILKGIAVILLVGFSLFMFLTSYVSVNNPSSDLLADTRINSTINSFNNSINSIKDLSNSAESIMRNESPSPTEYVFLIFRGAFTIPLSFLGLAATGFNTVSDGITQYIFGGSSNSLFIVIRLFNAVLVLILIISIIKFIRTGEGER